MADTPALPPKGHHSALYTKILTIAVSVLFTIVGFFCISLYTEFKATQTDVVSLKENIATISTDIKWIKEDMTAISSDVKGINEKSAQLLQFVQDKNN